MLIIFFRNRPVRNADLTQSSFQKKKKKKITAIYIF